MVIRAAVFTSAALLVGLELQTSCAPEPLQAAVPADIDQSASQKGQLAHPPVEGAAGPFSKARVVLTRRENQDGAPFSGILSAGAVRLTLAGPDEPGDFFLVEPRAVMFVPVDRSRANAVVILYDSSQIGPGHGTDHRALVYRIGRDRADRLPAIEARLEGATDAAAVRAKVRKNK